MIEEEGKCRAEAEARGLPENKRGMGERKQEQKRRGVRRMARKVRREIKSGQNAIRSFNFYCKAYITLYTKTFNTFI